MSGLKSIHPRLSDHTFPLNLRTQVFQVSVRIFGAVDEKSSQPAHSDHTVPENAVLLMETYQKSSHPKASEYAYPERFPFGKLASGSISAVSPVLRTSLTPSRIFGSQELVAQESGFGRSPTIPPVAVKFHLI